MEEQKTNVPPFILSETIAKYLPDKEKNGYFAHSGPNERLAWIVSGRNEPVVSVTNTLLVYGQIISILFEDSMRKALESMKYKITFENPAYLGYGFLYVIKPVE